MYELEDIKLMIKDLNRRLSEALSRDDRTESSRLCMDVESLEKIIDDYESKNYELPHMVIYSISRRYESRREVEF